VEQAHRRRDLEERQPAFNRPGFVALERVDGLAQFVDQRDDLVRRRRPAFDREALLQAVQVR
jgi:hypothetical protein